MNIKMCPFCGNKPKETYIKDKYVIICENCKQKGINLSIQADSKEEAQDLWNTRVFDKLLTLNKDQVSEKIDNYINGKYEVELNNLDWLALNKKHIGYFILPDEVVIRCTDGHTKEILHYLNIETEKDSFTESSLCKYFKIIRISILDYTIIIDIPLKYKKKQLKKALDILFHETLINKSLLTYNIGYFDINKKETIYTTKSLIEFDEKLKELEKNKCI